MLTDEVKEKLDLSVGIHMANNIPQREATAQIDELGFCGPHGGIPTGIPTVCDLQNLSMQAVKSVDVVDSGWKWPAFMVGKIPSCV